MKFLKSHDFVDKQKIGIASHSLGTTDAVLLGLLCDDISAIVFNDYIYDERHVYFSTTEYKEGQMRNNIGNWHEIPRIFNYLARPDLLSALAPVSLALTEGGAEIYLDKIRAAYKICNAEDNLFITHYPRYSDEKKRSKIYKPPMYGLSQDTSFEFYNVDAPDHSFRKDHSIRFFAKHFHIDLPSINS